VRKTCKLVSAAAGVLALALALVGAAGGADRKPIPPTAAFLTQEQITAQHLEFSFGAPAAGPCGYVPNVVPPQVSGSTDVGGTLTTWPGQWNPCSPPLVAVDVYWPSDGSHGTTHVVTAADQAAGIVCSQSTVWDSADDVGGPMTACISIPQPPPPPACVIDETQAPWISGDTSAGATLTMNGGSWQPSCGGGLSAADIAWWPDGSHSATYVVKSSDAGTTVCATVTVWDYNGASAHDSACIAIPASPPPPPPADTTPPTVALTAPAAGSVIFDPVDITADAADNIGVAGVQFRVDGVEIGTEDTSAPYGATWDIQASGAGTHTLTAVARDAAGNVTTSTDVTVTVSDGVTDGEGVAQTSATLNIPLSTTCSAATATAAASNTAAACVSNPACTGPKRAIGTAWAPAPGQPPITYRNKITQLVYWKASAAVDVCIDTGHHEIAGFGGARVVPLYTLPFVWSYDNAPHWSYGPTGKGVKTSWVQVTDSFSGCPFKVRFGCNVVTFTVHWSIQGSGKYFWWVQFV
jgi:Bacterial Ig domain